MQKMKIYSIRTGTSEDPDDVGIVIVLTALGNFPRACSMLVGLIYAVNLAYPKELRYMFEVFQKVLLEMCQERRIYQGRLGSMPGSDCLGLFRSPLNPVFEQQP
uniref:Uncharacterized protein n=1 Tax=Takifugu rubripes TaxID=31033 RepID=A0A674NAH2_TAKRU